MEKASLVFVRNELIPLQKRMMEINKLVSENIVKFDSYKLAT